MSDDSKPKAGTSRRKTLPPSGLAEEILGAIAEENGAPAPGQPPEVPKGPDRIYDFADTLEDVTLTEEERRKREEELETWVTFLLDGESFGLPVTHVQEILRVHSVTHVPHAPNPVRGVTNMRGRVLPVVDLRLRLGLAEGEIRPQSRILVVESRGRLIGLLVDAVNQVVRIARSRIQPPPADVMTARSDYILGVYHLDEALVIMLDVARVLVISGEGQAAKLRGETASE